MIPFSTEIVTDLPSYAAYLHHLASNGFGSQYDKNTVTIPIWLTDANHEPRLRGVERVTLEYTAASEEEE